MTLTPRQIRRRAKKVMIDSVKGKGREARQALVQFMKSDEFKEILNNHVARRAAMFSSMH